MARQSTKKRGTGIIIAAILLLVIIGIIAAVSLTHQPAQNEQSDQPVSGKSTSVTTAPAATFPSIDTTDFSDSQTALLNLLKKQFAEQNPGTYYSQGTKEAWCADFVSWNYMTIGHPFSNPNSGSWRIPGVATLEEYLQAQGVYHPIGEKGFTPQFGDIVIYDTSSPTWHQHTNIVLGYAEGKLTTIGGNQGGDHIQVTTKDIDSQLVIRGYGRIL